MGGGSYDSEWVGRGWRGGRRGVGVSLWGEGVKAEIGPATTNYHFRENYCEEFNLLGTGILYFTSEKQTNFGRRGNILKNLRIR